MKKLMLTIVLSCLVAVLASAARAQAGETKLHWYGHAAFSITTPKGKVLLIDPWLSNPQNPDADGGKDPLANLGKVDYILLTHGHRDHVGEAVEIAKRTGAILISNPELAGNLVKLTGFPAKQAQTDAIMGIGGEIKVADGEVTVAMTLAIHSSSVFNPNAGANEPERAYGGNPAGFVIIVKDGPTIYDSGDTAYFKDMEVIGEEYAIDFALLNIGGHYGMEPHMAARAAASVKARIAIPQHFEDAPESLAVFSSELKKNKHKTDLLEMKPGQTLILSGHKVKQ
jgi:L-ascorbate metabolism protein UlaG (beta-lactamase superfamily)